MNQAGSSPLPGSVNHLLVNEQFFGACELELDLGCVSADSAVKSLQKKQAERIESPQPGIGARPQPNRDDDSASQITRLNSLGGQMN